MMMKKRWACVMALLLLLALPTTAVWARGHGGGHHGGGQQNGGTGAETPAPVAACPYYGENCPHSGDCPYEGCPNYGVPPQDGTNGVYGKHHAEGTAGRGAQSQRDGVQRGHCRYRQTL